MEAAHTALHESAIKIRQLQEQGDNEGARRLFDEISLPSVEAVKTVLRSVSAMMDQEKGATIQTFTTNVEESRTLAIGASALGIILALLMGVLIARTVTAPIVELAKSADAIANGHLDAAISVKRADEIGNLAAAMYRISTVLQSILKDYQQLEKTSGMVNWTPRPTPARTKAPLPTWSRAPMTF